jgi:hypothetical protein
LDSYALNFPDRLKIVGVAEPEAHRTAKLRKLHDISDDDMVAADWRHFADLVCISLQSVSDK